MREIGRIVQENEAKVLADYLLTLEITTKLEPGVGGWAIWVHREDRVPEARGILKAFEASPNDLKFRAAAKSAEVIRKQSEKSEKAYRNRLKDLRDRWEGAMIGRAPLAFSLIIISVVTAILMKLTPSISVLFRFSLLAYSDERGVYDSGFAAIEGGQVWRLVTPIFLHFGLIHLFFNMAAMRFLGERVEVRKGSWRFALICLVAAIGGNVGEFYKSGGNFGGMSGVVFALAGYLWIKGHTDPEDGLFLDQRAVNWMICWFLLGIFSEMGAASGSSPILPVRMANVAHGVGLAVGMAFGLLRF